MLSLGLPGCGGDKVTNVTPPTTLPPVHAAAISSVGAGLLVVHPSADPRWSFALETPIRITETGGGNADWNFARLSSLRKGKEIERNEIGADVIRAAGFSRVAANTNKVYAVYFHINHDDFDDLVMTLGFGDIKDGRQFTTDVAGSTFDGVDISIIPKSVPSNGTIRLQH
jgi:hypothetical protein